MRLETLTLDLAIGRCLETLTLDLAIGRSLETLILDLAIGRCLETLTLDLSIRKWEPASAVLGLLLKTTILTTPPSCNGHLVVFIYVFI
jgi:hypothetical protein